MTTNIATATPGGADVIEQVLIGGDLARLNPVERVTYYNRVCESLGLNPLTKPFDYITLNGKLTLYAKRDCTDQLRKRDAISITPVKAEHVGDCYVVTVAATTPDGRTDYATGAVPLKGLSGENLCNALMKADTKARRRATLSICGLGWLDETELDTIKDKTPPATLKARLGLAPVEAAPPVEGGGDDEAPMTGPLGPLDDAPPPLCVYPFGRNKGRSIVDVKDEPLRFWVGKLREDLADERKRKWWEKAARDLRSVEAELRRRQTTEPPASAFASPDEWAAHLDPPADDLSLEA